MSLIPCTENCRYQQDGRCRLERIPLSLGAVAESDCIYKLSPTQTQWHAGRPSPEAISAPPGTAPDGASRPE